MNPGQSYIDSRGAVRNHFQLQDISPDFAGECTITHLDDGNVIRVNFDAIAVPTDGTSVIKLVELFEQAVNHSLSNLE